MQLYRGSGDNGRCANRGRAPHATEEGLHVQLCHSHRSRRPRPQHQGLRPEPHDRGGRARVVRLRPGLGRRVGALLRVAQGGLRVRRHRLPPLPRPARPRPRLRGGRRLQDAAPSASTARWAPSPRCSAPPPSTASASRTRRCSR